MMMISPIVEVYDASGNLTPDGLMATECYQTWGEIQLDVVVEELAELIEALETARIYPYMPEHIQHIAEEYVDVELVLAQLWVIMDLRSGKLFSLYLQEERSNPDRDGEFKDCVMSLARLIQGIQKGKRKGVDNLGMVAMMYVDLEVALRHMQIYTDGDVLESWSMQTFQRYRDEYRQSKRDRLRMRLDMTHKAKVMKCLNRDSTTRVYGMRYAELKRHMFLDEATLVKICDELVHDNLVVRQMAQFGYILVASPKTGA